MDFEIYIYIYLSGFWKICPQTFRSSAAGGRTGPPALAKTWGGYASRLMPRPDPGTGLPAGGWLAASFEKQGGRGGVRFWYTECFSLWILHVLVLIVDCGLSCFSQWNHSHWTEGHPLKEQRSSCAPQVAMGWPGGVAWGSGPNPTFRSSWQVCLCKSSQILGPKRPFLAQNQLRGSQGERLQLAGHSFNSQKPFWVHYLSGFWKICPQTFRSSAAGGRTGPPALAKTWGGYASRLMPRPDPGTGLPAGGWLAASFEKQGGRGGVRFWYTECFSLWILHVLVLIVDCGLSCFSQWNHSHWTEGHPLKNAACWTTDIAIVNVAISCSNWESFGQSAILWRSRGATAWFHTSLRSFQVDRLYSKKGKLLWKTIMVFVLWRSS